MGLNKTDASFVLYVWLTATNSILAFFQTPARFWEFGADGLLVFMPERGAESASQISPGRIGGK